MSEPTESDGPLPAEPDERSGASGAPSPGDASERPGGPDVNLDAAGGEVSFDRDDELAPSEAFGVLASEVRVAVLCHLLAAERADETPRSFSELQAATDVDTSAGFAYHLRQLDGHFVRRTEEGYALAPAGRRAARAVVEGTFTAGSRADPAS